MKKFVSILFLVVMGFSMVACGSSDDGAEAAPKIDAAKDAEVQKDGNAQATPTSD